MTIKHESGFTRILVQEICTLEQPPVPENGEISMMDGEMRIMDGPSEELLASARLQLSQIIDSLATTNGQDLDTLLELGRTIIRRLDSTPFWSCVDRDEEQTWFLRNLQRLAYFESDGGGVQDIAQWCFDKWLLILQREGESVEALEGLANAWLCRAQLCLARIHHDEGSSSSGMSSGPAGSRNHRYTSSDEARDAAIDTAEADARLHTADYVEARGILLPSTEYYARAVVVAERQQRLTGELLASTAEAFMSLGNVSYSSSNERHFRQALLYLRRASRVSGYALSPYLQQWVSHNLAATFLQRAWKEIADMGFSYLDDYGRLIDND